MSFHSSWGFFFFLVLALVVFAVWLRRKNLWSTLRFSDVNRLKSVQQSLRARLAFLPTLLKVLALVFLVVAIARPQSASTHMKRNVEGIDIMIALDISDSMLVEDMHPSNRLEAAKETIKNFVGKRVTDRIGIVVFAGESFTLVPLTLDYQLLLGRVEEITTAQQARIKDGTALGVALANAAGRLKESVAKSRVIIFLTDGENNSGTIDPETGLEIAKGYGLKIYSIGIGRDGPSRIPVYQRDIFGNQVKTYQPFESRVNDDLLGRMASDTGGKYYRASEADSLEGVFSEIDRLERTKIDVNKYTRYEELFTSWAFIAFLLYAIGWFLSLTFFRRGPL